MDLIRDVLDKQIIDRDGDKMGKVDGIILEYEPGQRPRVICLEVGPVTLMTRLNRRLGSVVKKLTERLGIDPTPTRISMNDVDEISIEVRIAVDGDETPAFGWENWLRTKIIRRIPGSGA